MTNTSGPSGHGVKIRQTTLGGWVKERIAGEINPYTNNRGGRIIVPQVVEKIVENFNVLALQLQPTTFEGTQYTTHNRTEACVRLYKSRDPRFMAVIDFPVIVKEANDMTEALRANQYEGDQTGHRSKDQLKDSNYFAGHLVEQVIAMANSYMTDKAQLRANLLERFTNHIAAILFGYVVHNRAWVHEIAQNLSVMSRQGYLEALTADEAGNLAKTTATQIEKVARAVSYYLDVYNFMAKASPSRSVKTTISSVTMFGFIVCAYLNGSVGKPSKNGKVARNPEWFYKKVLAKDDDVKIACDVLAKGKDLERRKKASKLLKLLTSGVREED